MKVVRPRENPQLIVYLSLHVSMRKRSSNPDVVPELAFENGQWIFTNFHYGKTGSPVNENLVSVLQILKKDRRKKAK
jgi:hypothetical protein